MTTFFEKKTNNTKRYRFVFTDFKLILEEARLAPVFERTLLTLKKQLAYPGVARFQLVEPIPNGTATYKTLFQDICMPEALLIFCLDKQ